MEPEDIDKWRHNRNMHVARADSPAADPARIDPLLDLIRAWWVDHPTWRLGQIIDNLAAMPCPSANTTLRVSTFYLRDEQLEERMQQLRERVTLHDSSE